nr:10880_t:CDS:2 [Entrophospora candida]
MFHSYVQNSEIIKFINVEEVVEEIEDGDETDTDAGDDGSGDDETEGVGAFEGLVREIEGPRVRFESGAIRELQRITERRLIRLFRDANRCANYAGKTEVGIEDIRFAAEFRESIIIETLTDYF